MLIRRHVARGDDQALLYRIENGRIRPPKMLVDSLVGMLKGNQAFVLIDDQKVAYENALAAARAASPRRKQVVLSLGGPGTGKSVLAINLLVELTKVCRHVSKSAAPRAVFQSRLAGVRNRGRLLSLFSGSGHSSIPRRTCSTC